MSIQTVEQVKVPQLREAIKGFNALPFVTKKIQFNGVKTEKMRDDFLTAVEALSDDDLAKIPKKIGEVYNEVAGTSVEEPPVAPPVEKKQAPVKKEGKKKVEKKATAKPTPTVEGKKRTIIYKEILSSGKFTRPEIRDKMLAEFGGSKNEAEFTTGIFTRLLVDMGYATIDAEKKVCLKK